MSQLIKQLIVFCHIIILLFCHHHFGVNTHTLRSCLMIVAEQTNISLAIRVNLCISTIIIMYMSKYVERVTGKILKHHQSESQT